MPITPDSDDFLARLHETYARQVHGPLHGPVRTPDSDAGFKFLFRDAQPGSAEFARAHLVGSSAPEPIIERMGPIGAEDFGPVELIDGRTGQPITRVNRHLRRRLER